MDILTQEQIISIIHKEFKKAKAKKRKCLVDGCKNFAINSHVLWKKGILSKIANKSHLIEIDSTNFIFGKGFKFSQTSIDKILRFKGFCNIHDDKIFKIIENDKMDLFDQKNQILFSIRGLFHEMQKKEINVEAIEGVLNLNILPYEEQIATLMMLVYNNKLGINDISFYTSELNKEFYNVTGKFHFKTFQLPFVPIVSSSMFSIDGIYTQNTNRVIDKNCENVPLNTFLFNFFPFKGKSYLIIGFHTNYLNNLAIFNKLSTLNENELLQIISDILIGKVESWACSMDFYEKFIKEDEQIILKLFQENGKDFTGNKMFEFNMFSRWLMSKANEKI
jgi:hypothetical protein